MSRLTLTLVALLLFPNFSFAQGVGPTRQPTHEVVKGETLWILAERYLGDPFKWPLIFEANRETIQNPNSISPGQILAIPGPVSSGAMVQGVTVTTPGGRVQVPEGDVPMIRIVSRPSSGRTIFYGSRGSAPGSRGAASSQAARTAFFAEERVPSSQTVTLAHPAIRATELLPVPGGLVFGASWLEGPGIEPGAMGFLARFAPGQKNPIAGRNAIIRDRIRIQVAGDAGVRVGDLLQSFKVVREEEGLGKVLRPTGLLVVTSVGEEVEVQLTAEFGPVRLGDLVRMAPPYDIPSGAEAAPVESNVTATIVGFPVDRVVYGIGAQAFLDVGDREGITIGDEFKAYHGTAGPSFGMESATLQVVLVHGNVSTARVIKLKRPTLGTGDRLRLVRKMY